MNRCLLSLIVIPAALLVACQPAGNAPPPAEGVPASSAPPPTRRSLVIPEGTTLHLTLENSLSSATNSSGDAVLAKLTEDVSVGGKLVAAAGSEVRGRVTTSIRSGKTKGRARLAFGFD